MEFDKMVDNNLKGIELEKKGQTKRAMNLYKENVKARFDGNHPYDRLAIIYRKNKEYEKEIEVLNVAIDVFENDVYKGRGDRIPKLKKFNDRLKKAKDLKRKNDLV